MCQICVDLCREFHPEIPDSEMGDFLMGFTSFPFSHPEHLKKELRDMRLLQEMGVKIDENWHVMRWLLE